MKGDKNGQVLTDFLKMDWGWGFSSIIPATNYQVVID
jgi:hypothetical protein